MLVPTVVLNDQTREAESRRRLTWKRGTKLTTDRFSRYSREELEKLTVDLDESLANALAEVQRLKTRGGIARSLIPVAQVEKVHRRCKELGV